MRFRPWIEYRRISESTNLSVPILLSFVRTWYLELSLAAGFCHLIPDTKYELPGSWYQVRGNYCVPVRDHPVSRPVCLVLGVWHIPEPGTWYPAAGTWYLVPGTRDQIPSTCYQVPGTWLQVSIAVTSRKGANPESNPEQVLREVKCNLQSRKQNSIHLQYQDLKSFGLDPEFGIPYLPQACVPSMSISKSGALVGCSSSSDIQLCL